MTGRLMAKKARSKKSSGGFNLRLSAPTQMMFAISLIAFVLGLIGEFVRTVPVVGPYHFWFLVVSYVLLAAGVTMKGI